MTIISGYAKVRVALTAAGVDVLNRNDEAFIDYLPPSAPMRRTLRDRINARQPGDMYETDFWTLMSDFGPTTTVGCMLPFVAGEIEIVDDATHAKALKRRMYRV